MWAVVAAFLTDNAEVLGGGAALLSSIEILFSPFRALARRFRKPEQVVIANPEAFLPKSAAAAHGIQMDVETFTALQSKLRDDARAELALSNGAERQLLEDKIATLNAALPTRMRLWPSNMLSSWIWRRNSPAAATNLAGMRWPPPKPC